jgi:hypothetical protein
MKVGLIVFVPGIVSMRGDLDSIHARDRCMDEVSVINFNNRGIIVQTDQFGIMIWDITISRRMDASTARKRDISAMVYF